VPAPVSVTWTTAVLTAVQTAVLAEIDDGVSNAVLKLYTEADVLLATLTLSDPAGTVTSGTLTITATGAATAVDTGTCTWGRVETSAGTAIVDAPVSQGVAPVAGSIILSNTSIVTGADVTLASFTIG